MAHFFKKKNKLERTYKDEDINQRTFIEVEVWLVSSFTGLENIVLLDVVKRLNQTQSNW